MKNNQAKSKKGFTIIELSISIVFLSVLMLTIAILIINMLAIYQKGLTIKSVTSTGSELIDEFSRAISSAPVFNIDKDCSKLAFSTEIDKCKKDGGTKRVYYQKTDKLEFKLPNGNTETKTLPLYGAFCTGRFSYLWNTAYTFPLAWEGREKPDKFDQIKRATLEYKLGSSTSFQKLENFRLIKFVDYDKKACSDEIVYAEPATPNYRLTDPLKSPPIELLDSSEDNLALYDFKIFRPSQHKLTNHSFYSGTFILATIRGGIDITGAGDYCQDPPKSTLSSDFSYCAINKFNFAIRATGQYNTKERN